MCVYIYIDANSATSRIFFTLQQNTDAFSGKRPHDNEVDTIVRPEFLQAAEAAV